MMQSDQLSGARRCDFCGCTFRLPHGPEGHCCAAMQQAMDDEARFEDVLREAYSSALDEKR